MNRVATLGAGLMLISCWAGVCANFPQKPVVLPVVDASDIRFNHVFYGKGPAHSRAHRIIQDQQGFLWLATADRLQRYDGYDVREYRWAPSDPNVFTRALIKDRLGQFWIARDRGVGLNAPAGSLNRFEPATGTFTRYPPHDSPFGGPIIGITQIAKARYGSPQIKACSVWTLQAAGRSATDIARMTLPALAAIRSARPWKREMVRFGSQPLRAWMSSIAGRQGWSSASRCRGLLPEIVPMLS